MLYAMSEVELLIVNSSDSCTMYTIQFLSDDRSEFEKFISDKILILGNGGVKRSRTYEEDETLRGYVIDLQKFERLLKQEIRAGNVEITEKDIITGKTFDI